MKKPPSKGLRFHRIHLENWRTFTRMDVALQSRVFKVRRRSGVGKIRSLAARQSPDVEIEVAISIDSQVIWVYELRLSEDVRRAVPQLEDLQFYRNEVSQQPIPVVSENVRIDTGFVNGLQDNHAKPPGRKEAWAISFSRSLRFKGRSPWFSLEGNNSAASRSHWTVLTDLDHGARCAPELARRWLPKPVPMMGFQVAFREIEAWLISVALALRSRREKIKKSLVPRSGSGHAAGPAHEAFLRNFARTKWRPREPEARA